MILNSPKYGVRELSLRGAPLSREDWLKRNSGHDIRIIEIPDVSIRLVDEMEEVDETVVESDPRTGLQKTRKTGQKVMRPTGRKIEERGPAGSNLTIFYDITTGVLGVDHEDAKAPESK